MCSKNFGVRWIKTYTVSQPQSETESATQIYGIVLSQCDGKVQAPGMTAPRPKRLLTASRRLLDASNSAVPTLSTHKHAIEAQRASDQAAKQLQASKSLSVASDTPIPSTSESTPLLPMDTSEISDYESQPRELFYFNVTV